ncbi:MAG: hypothetical protein KatS3mg001_360 [Candidatus Pacearchaeota archaeon]|nr:MAG: hypothetical protein KatS3mg001_360 [Candidatus Pacearchaeota archaeon]
MNLKIEPRVYQKKIAETCIKSNCLVILPTGLGKTLIALMVSLERLNLFPEKKVLFLAPTKPLAEQHYNFFKFHLGDTFPMCLFTGKVKSEKRKELWEKNRIIFSTPQCTSNDLKKGNYDLKEVCLLVEDEAHRCIKNYDYTYIAKRYIKDSKNVRIIGLTASPGSEISKIKEICENLGIEAIEIRTRESEDVKPYLKKLEVEIVNVELPKDFLEIRDLLKNILKSYVEDLKKRHLLFGPPTKTNLVKLQKKLFLLISTGNKNYNFLLGMKSCASALKIFHAIELLETQSLKGLNNYLKELFRQAEKKENKAVISLVKKPEFNKVFIKTNEILAKNLEHPKLGKIKEIVKKELEKNKEVKILIFTHFRETANMISSELKKVPGVKSEIFIGQSKKQKHEKGLTQKEQKKIIEEFTIKKINVLCATSVGEEGLDIPEVDVVIFYEPVPSAIRTIQRAGRTARLKEGKLIILITKKTRDEVNFYTSKSKEKKMLLAINNIKEKTSNKKIQKDKETQRNLDFYIK